MLAVLAVTISVLMVQINLANSQSDCSVTSASCMSPLTSNFTADCTAGRLSNYAECLSNNDCLNPNTADIQLNPQYCGGGGCVISCVGKH